MESVRAAISVCSLPPCGGGLGRGVVHVGNEGAAIATPTPNPSPQGGGERTECAALFCVEDKPACSKSITGRTIVVQQSSAGAIALMAALCLTAGAAQAWDDTK